MVITFASPFLITVALLFGPIYASIAYLVSDIVSYIIRPLGVYMWEYALLLVIKGYLVGFLFSFIKKINITVYKKLFILLNSVIIIFVPSFIYFSVSTGIERILILSIIILLISCIINLMIYLILNIKFKHLLIDYLKVNFSISIPYIVATIVSTFIFKEYYGLTKETAMIILIPRVLEELFMVILYSIVCSIFLGIFSEYINKGEIK